MEALFFYLFGTVAVLAALLTVTRREPVTSAFWLIGCFLSVACLFALLSAHFMAILQILLYAGAIMVFFLFVIMFLGKDRPVESTSRHWFLIGMATVLAAGILMTRLVRGERGEAREFPELSGTFGGVEGVSELLLTEYIFGFELTGLLLTVAVIGAVHLARREAPGTRGSRSPQGATIHREGAEGV